MANQVFANGLEISCKAAVGKSVACFPDVCFTPPQTPATPPGVPIPYPNTGMASDTSNGSRTVKISGQEVMLKDKSYFKTSYGDEAGCAPKKGVITSKIKGKVYFTAWSMDVKFEGQNVDRMSDLTTHNHGSQGNTVPWPYLDEVALALDDHPCAKSGDAKKVNDNCKKPIASDCSDDCCKARRCVLVPFSPNSCVGCGDKTPHHPIPVAELSEQRKAGEARGQPRYPKYSEGAAPCVCVEGKDHDSRNPVSTELDEHGRVGAKFAQLRNDRIPKKSKLGDPYDFSIALDCGAQAVSSAMGCDEACVRKQLEAGHTKLEVKPTDKAFKSKQKANVPLFKKPKIAASPLATPAPPK
ncbi:PAAR-like domain-containing protein [Pseudomonas sp. USHLN015]|uniref:PAAR-like domain-containing protein n=2 Tax=unclassified Pseudomonas TaxID=196821 RepID=UPI00301DD5AA